MKSRGQTECMLVNTLINHLMYADADLGIFSQSSAGFQPLINLCSHYGIKYDVQYNAKECCPDM